VASNDGTSDELLAKIALKLFPTFDAQIVKAIERTSDGKGINPT